MNEKSKRLRTISIMFLLTLTGKVLGLVRDMLMGRYFGTGPVADAFFVASQVPRNFFDAIFASAISASFIPVFNEYLEKEGREEAFRLASSFITLMALLTTALMAALIVLMVWGFTSDPADAPPMALLVVMIAIPGVIILGVLLALFQRIKEIQKGEEDDAKNY